MISEIELLKSLWEKNPNRLTKSKTLIVPGISKTQTGWSLNNEHWAYNVGYCFREALGIRLEERKIKGKPTMEWLQAPIIKFKNGDTFIQHDKSHALQVRFANPMGWEPITSTMNLGSIAYTKFKIVDGYYLKMEDKNVTQLEFLEFLINGN